MILPLPETVPWQAEHPGFVRIAWLLWLGFALHEAELWNLVAVYQTHFPGGPAMSSAHLRVALCAGVAIFWLWTLAAMRARSAQRAAFFILPFAAAMFLEFLQHAYWTALTREYQPGMIASFTVVGPAILLLVHRAWRGRLVSRSYVVLLTAIVLVAFGAWAIRFPASLTEKMAAADRMGAAIARVVGY
jgi:hypothetical protein